MYWFDKDIKQVHDALDKIPLCAYNLTILQQVRKATRTLPDSELIKLTMHMDISADIFYIVFERLVATNNRDYFYFLFRDIINELFYTHQEQKIVKMLQRPQRIQIPCELAEIFIHGDSEAISLAIKLKKQYPDSTFETEKYLSGHIDMCDKVFMPPLSEEKARKIRLLLANTGLLSANDTFVLFVIMLKNGYPYSDVIMSSDDLEGLLYYTMNYYASRFKIPSLPQYKRIPFVTLLLESFPDLEVEINKKNVLAHAVRHGHIILTRFFRERYPEAQDDSKEEVVYNIREIVLV